ncbi:DUF1010 domain-containing protein [Simplicispira sp.]
MPHTSSYFPAYEYCSNHSLKPTRILRAAYLVR